MLARIARGLAGTLTCALILVPGGVASSPVEAAGARALAGEGSTLAARGTERSLPGLRPAAGTRVRPTGVPDTWRITGTKTAGGTRYYDPSNPGNSVRVMQGSPGSPYPTSQGPYVRWQQNGRPLDANGNVLPSANVPKAHIPLEQFNFRADLFR